MSHQQLARCILDLHNRFAADIGENERLVIDLVNRLLLDHLNQRGAGILPELRVDRPEHRVWGHDDFISRERNQRSARHGVVRHQHGHFALVAPDRARNLQGREDQSTRRV
jgi:hypothetical protein